MTQIPADKRVWITLYHISIVQIHECSERTNVLILIFSHYIVCDQSLCNVNFWLLADKKRVCCNKNKIDK